MRTGLGLFRAGCGATNPPEGPTGLGSPYFSVSQPSPAAWGMIQGCVNGATTSVTSQQLGHMPGTSTGIPAAALLLV